MLMPIQLYIIIRSLVFMSFSVSTWTKEGVKVTFQKHIDSLFYSNLKNFTKEQKNNNLV